MKKIFALLVCIVFLINCGFSQQTLYYNSQSEITIPEFANHHRICTINVEKRHFIGEVKEYRIDSTLKLIVNYDSMGIKNGTFKLYSQKGDSIISYFLNNSLINESDVPDSVILEILKKEHFSKAQFIRKNDYIEIKALFAEKYQIKTDTFSIDGEEEVFSVVAEYPSFPGGMSKFTEILSYFLVYPDQARKHGISGKVFVQFIVKTDGTISDINVIKGIGYGCDEAAANALRKMPDWNPGFNLGVPVNVKMVLPITFR